MNSFAECAEISSQIYVTPNKSLVYIEGLPHQHMIVSPSGALNKIGNPSNGPAVVTWLNMFCLGGYNVSVFKMSMSGHIWSQVVKVVLRGLAYWMALQISDVIKNLG